MKNKKRP